MKPRKPTPRERAIATEIAATLGETEERPRKQIERILGLMGEWWTRATANAAKVCHESIRPALRRDGSPRTLGGAFFAHARKQGEGMVDVGQLTRREFFRCFTDWPPKVREKKPAPKPRPVRAAHATKGNVRIHDRRSTAQPVAEVYVRRAVR